MSEMGFTLVELLVVVGIISALVAILLPALARARDHANTVKCAANLRSIGQALTMYTQRYGHYPASSAYKPTVYFTIWATRLRVFTGSDRSVFNCPSQDERCDWKFRLPPPSWPAGDLEAQFGYDTGESVVDSWSAFFSYGYNFKGTHGSEGSVRDGTHRGLGLRVNPVPVPLDRGGGEVAATRVKSPENMIAIADTTADGWGDSMISTGSDFRNYKGKSVWPGKVHRGGANVLFCDGHVQWYQQSQITVADWSDPKYFPIRQMWNNDNQP